MAQDRPRVVIVGAGFGGLWAARALAGSGTQVLVVDRRNYHTFLPLLYQVAAAEIEPEDIAYPIRSILRGQSNAQFALAHVSSIDLERRLLTTTDAPIAYDTLILAPGSVTHFLSVPGASQHAFPLKTLDQAVAIRNHILQRFEHATREPDPERRMQALTFTIVGGGATGVEFAGALAELISGPLVKDFPSLDVRAARLVLLEAAPGLLGGLPECCRAYARRRLTRMGVDVRLSTRVSAITPETVHLDDGAVLPTQTVVWTAGVRGPSIARSWGLPVAKDGRIPVLPTLQVPGHPEIYVVGDLCRFQTDTGVLPMVAPVAIAQGTTAARNILLQMAGRSPEPFHYHDRGVMVTIGRNAAVALVGRASFTGFFAWLVWLSVHLIQLIGFRNRLLVLINWAWDYILYDRAVRLVLGQVVDPHDEFR